ncbi:MAG: tetratricopeptide repeat protein [Xanthomonadales bacterium]|nr:tetratricopeptide repeat protein [Xanthomonadales bacterium]
MTRSPAEDRLESWKAIARYLGRSVRTVRRWEQQEGLPVHRLMHQSQASVYAFPRELDDWRASRAQGPSEAPPTPPARTASPGPPAPAGPGDTAAIAVLPFSFAGPDPSQAWVADGLTEEMIGGFSRLAKLRVTSRTSSAALKGSERDSSAIAELLGVTYLLEGGVIGDGRRLRINVRLIDPRRDDHVWSRKFAGDMDQVFDIQEQIARAVVNALQLELEPREEAAFGRPAVSDLSAWRRVILARETAFQWRPDALEQARNLLTEALEIAGENAAICATMGRVLLHHVEAGIPDRERVLEEARSWEARARAADPDHPETRVLSGWLAHTSGDLGGAVRELEAALRADHDNPDALLLLAHCLLRIGLTDRARPVIEHAMAVDPLTPLTRCFPGYLAAMEGRFDEAVDPYHDMLDRDPANPVARLWNVWVHFAAGRDDEAIAIASGFDGPAAESTPAHLARHLVAAHLGTIEDLPLPRPVREAAEGSEMYARHAAEAWALAGKTKRTALWLDRAVDLGFVNWPYLAKHSPFLAPLADDPELKPVLDKAKARWQTLGNELR